MKYTGKTVIITGASSGIGLAIAEFYSQLGANTVLAARSLDKLLEITSRLTSPSIAVKCDVADQAQCKELVSQAVKAFGGVDILVNNAGLSMRALFDDVDIDVLRKLMDVNFWGTVNCTKYALPYIQESKGSIIGISSVAGLHGLPARTGYSASKYAMHGFLETIRIENLHKGVHVMLVSPGFTESNVRLSALTSNGQEQGESPREEGKMMTAAEVAKLVEKGVRKKKRLMALDFNGKATILIKKFWPALLDRLFYNHMAKETNSPLVKKKLKR